MCIAGCTPNTGSSSSSGGGQGSSAAVGAITYNCCTQTPHITTISGPKDLGCGSFDWRIWWDIPNAAGKNGWVIQEITATFDVRNADGTVAFHKVYHYWEAWPVEPGKTVTRFQDKHESPPFDDQYLSSPPRPNTRGTTTFVGKAKFFEGNLPPDFKQNNPDTIAGDLYSTTKRPSFWDGTGVDHNLTATWDCTTTPGTSSVSATAGNQTLQGTK